MKTKTEETNEEEIHSECITEEALEAAEEERDKAEEDAAASRIAEEEARRCLERFGSHTAACLFGALAGSQKLHPLCTCGWNQVATEIERW
jgi:hypothetical protein